MGYRIHVKSKYGIRTYEVKTFKDLEHKVSILDAELCIDEIVIYDEDTQQCYSRSMFSGDLQSSDKIKWISPAGYELNYGDLKPS